MHQRKTLAHTSAGINPQKNEQQDGKSPKRRPTITEERKRNTNNGSKSEYHTHIYEKMEEDNAHDTVSVHPSEASMLTLRQ